MTDNMDMYTKHLTTWAQKERVAGFRSQAIADPVAQPDVTVEPGQEALTTDDINPPDPEEAEYQPSDDE